MSINSCVHRAGCNSSICKACTYICTHKCTWEYSDWLRYQRAPGHDQPGRLPPINPSTTASETITEHAQNLNTAGCFWAFVLEVSPCSSLPPTSPDLSISADVYVSSLGLPPLFLWAKVKCYCMRHRTKAQEGCGITDEEGWGVSWKNGFVLHDCILLNPSLIDELSSLALTCCSDINS